MSDPRLPDPAAVPATFWSVVGPSLRRCRWHILLAAVLVGIHGIAMALQNVYPKWFFSNVLEPTHLSPAERWHNLLLLVVGYLALSLFMRMTLWHTGYRLFTWARERVVLDLRSQFFRHVNHLCLRFHGEHPSGELFSYLFGSPLGNIMNVVNHATMNLPGAVFNLAFTLGIFWSWDRDICLLLCAACLASLVMMSVSRRRVKAISQDFMKTEGDLGGHVADVLRGSKAVKLYAMERAVSEDFEEKARLIGRKSYYRDVFSHIEWMKQEALGYFTYSALLVACTWRYMEGSLELGVIAACLTSYAGLQWPLNALYQAATMWGSASASIDRIGRVLTTASSTPDPVGIEQRVPRHGDIAFGQVSFSYLPGQPVLTDINLAIPYGQKVALVGPSGAGKSTVMQLLLRLYDPQEGTVRIGATDLRRVRGSELRRAIGVVPQDPFIFRSSLRENLRVARPDAADAALIKACEMANAWEFVRELPEGMDTLVGEGGSTLSGGQRQRLAIARVLLGEPDYFIFDEATSALDTVSERLIQQAIEANLGMRTAIFIAHRLATVKHCDRIIVLRGGRIEQDGSYAVLADQPGLFRELVAGQQLVS